jgi:glyoxylase-like metal-dependent hydrolase (beta-lactamase superfamily II)
VLSRASIHSVVECVGRLTVNIIMASAVTRLVMTNLAGALYRFTLGRFELFALSDSAGGNWRRPFTGRVVAGLADSVRLAQRIPSAPHPAPRTSLLARGPGMCALIDPGAGATTREPGQLLRHLSLAGVCAEEVDTIILTHAHLGHMGGALGSDGRLAFPNARYTLAAEEWEFWMTQPDLRSRRLQRMADRIHAQLSALQDRVTLITGKADILPGVQAIPTYGHTTGHLAISITSEGEELLCLADTAQAPIHLEHPEWFSRLDLRPEQSVTSRVRLLDRAAASGALIHAYHFPFPGLGWARPSGRAWRWEPLTSQ